MSEPKKLNVLDEVRADAEYNYLKRLKQQKDDAAYEAAKEAGDVGALEQLKNELLNKEEEPKEKK